jgi:hypothetical protein
MPLFGVRGEAFLATCQYRLLSRKRLRQGESDLLREIGAVIPVDFIPAKAISRGEGSEGFSL